MSRGKDLDAFDRACPELRSDDPLGERRALAKRYWIEDGAPSEASWEEYWSRAEATLAGGSDLRLVLQKTSDEAKAHADPNPQTTSALFDAILAAVPRPLEAHELFCIGVLLRSSIFGFAGGIALGPLSQERTSEMLEALRNSAAQAIPRDEIARICQSLSEDIPLSNHDRTTIARLQEQVRNSGSITSIVPAEETQVQVELADGSLSTRTIK